MGTLATFLQLEFAERCPDGWVCRREAPLLDASSEALLGYASKADVLLERIDGSRHLWIEFEISRADPVANHAKFATSNLFCPLPPNSAFLSMVSPHVVRGRRNLATATVHLMRRTGIEAYQTTLLPGLDPQVIKHLNHLPLQDLQERRPIAIAREIERAMAVTQPVFQSGDVRVHLAGELLEVMCSVRRWNHDLETDLGRGQWGRRNIIYFVFDPSSGTFAPSKFCAYLPFVTALSVSGHAAPSEVLASREMTVALYVQIEYDAQRFDGKVAWNHLTRNLGMRAVHAGESPQLDQQFGRWADRVRRAVNVHSRGPVFLIPPEWF